MNEFKSRFQQTVDSLNAVLDGSSMLLDRLKDVDDPITRGALLADIAAIERQLVLAKSAAEFMP